MGTEVLLVLAVVLITIGQQAFYMAQIHALVNKLMSRNYADYEQSQKVSPERRIKKQDQGLPDDLGVLDEFKIQLP